MACLDRWQVVGSGSCLRLWAGRRRGRSCRWDERGSWSCSISWLRPAGQIRRPRREAQNFCARRSHFIGSRIMSAAYCMTEWYCGQLGRSVFERPAGSAEGMSPEEAGLNRIKKLSTIQLRNYQGLKELASDPARWRRRVRRLDRIASRLYNAMAGVGKGGPTSGDDVVERGRWRRSATRRRRAGHRIESWYGFCGSGTRCRSPADGSRDARRGCAADSAKSSPAKSQRRRARDRTPAGRLAAAPLSAEYGDAEVFPAGRIVAGRLEALLAEAAPPANWRTRRLQQILWFRQTEDLRAAPPASRRPSRGRDSRGRRCGDRSACRTWRECGRYRP